MYFEFVIKIRRRHKKRHGYNFTFQVLPLNQPQNIPIGTTLIQYGGLKQKIVAASFFANKNRDILPDFEQQ